MYRFKDLSLAIVLGTVDDSQLTIELEEGEGEKFVDPSVWGSYKAWLFDATLGSPALDKTPCEEITITDVTDDMLTITRDNPVAHDNTQHRYMIVHSPSAEFLNSLVARSFYLRIVLQNEVGTIQRCNGFTQENIAISWNVDHYEITSSDNNFTDEMFDQFTNRLKVIESYFSSAGVWKLMPDASTDKIVLTIYSED